MSRGPRAGACIRQDAAVVAEAVDPGREVVDVAREMDEGGADGGQVRGRSRGWPGDPLEERSHGPIERCRADVHGGHASTIPRSDGPGSGIDAIRAARRVCIPVFERLEALRPHTL